MNHDETDPLARLLGEAFDAQARGAVGDHVRPPVPRFADAPVAAPRRGTRLWAPLAAAAAVVAVVAGVLGASGAFGGGDDDTPVAAATSAAVPSGSTSPSRSVPAGAVRAAPGAAPVRVKLVNAEGATYGVGMPVVALFSARVTDGRALQAATTATVDGRPVQGSWYFETSTAEQGYPVEAHFRPRAYWPAHAAVRVEVAAEGLSAGGDLGYANDLALNFSTGAAQIITVDEVAHSLTFARDGREVGRYPVSLGSDATPTSSGTKVIMEKGSSVRMSGPGYDEPDVKFAQRVTSAGEYLHAAPWNVANIEKGKDTSNGCTNMLPSDAETLYRATRVGDVVRYPNAEGRPMTLGEGYGDWNVVWDQWLTGGLVRTR